MNIKYKNLLTNSEWYKKRKIILLRDQYKCRNCGSNKELNIHHRQYHINRKTGKFVLPWKYKIKYLITLCKTCHEAGHYTIKINNHKL